MRCCHCHNQITQEELNKGLANELMGEVSHKSCDEAYFERQEKLVVYTKSHVFETGDEF